MLITHYNGLRKIEMQRFRSKLAGTVNTRFTIGATFSQDETLSYKTIPSTTDGATGQADEITFVVSQSRIHARSVSAY